MSVAPPLNLHCSQETTNRIGATTALMVKVRDRLNDHAWIQTAPVLLHGTRRTLSSVGKPL